MGIYFKNIVVYGIKFSYNEVVILTDIDEYKKFVHEELDCLPEDPSHLPCFWGDYISLYDEYDCEVVPIISSPYPGCSSVDIEYYLGLELTNSQLDYIRNFDTESVHKKIIDFCKKYKLPYQNKEIKMYYTVYID